MYIILKNNFCKIPMINHSSEMHNLWMVVESDVWKYEYESTVHICSSLRIKIVMYKSEVQRHVRRSSYAARCTLSLAPEREVYTRTEGSPARSAPWTIIIWILYSYISILRLDLFVLYEYTRFWFYRCRYAIQSKRYRMLMIIYFKLDRDSFR